MKSFDKDINIILDTTNVFPCIDNKVGCAEPFTHPTDSLCAIHDNTNCINE